MPPTAEVLITFSGPLLAPTRHSFGHWQNDRVLARVVNNWLRRPVAKGLFVRGSQIKLSHFDAVAWNVQQLPDHFYVRPRPLH
jgi:hypothetical protein